jgi:hypothetical protein
MTEMEHNDWLAENTMPMDHSQMMDMDHTVMKEMNYDEHSDM